MEKEGPRSFHPSGSKVSKILHGQTGGWGPCQKVMSPKKVSKRKGVEKSSDDIQDHWTSHGRKFTVGQNQRGESTTQNRVPIRRRRGGIIFVRGILRGGLLGWGGGSKRRREGETKGDKEKG